MKSYRAVESLHSQAAVRPSNHNRRFISFLSLSPRSRLEVGGSVLGVGPPAAAATVWELVTGHLSIRLSLSPSSQHS